MPSTRSEELSALAGAMAATKAMRDVAPLAAFESEIAAAVVEALGVMLKARQAEAEREAEGTRLGATEPRAAGRHARGLRPDAGPR